MSTNHNDRINVIYKVWKTSLVFNLILSHSIRSKSNFDVIRFAFRCIPLFEHDKFMNLKLFGILTTINS
jgi:hypothetical protein